MPVESRDDLVKAGEYQPRTRERLVEILSAQDANPRSWQAEAATRIESDAKRIAELEAERERLWCTACGTVTRDNVCDCNRWPHLADAGYKPNFVNYADALNEQTRDLAEKLESAERALAEERERHQWRTIDSAPKDGTLIDLWMMSEHRRLANCRWSTADEPSHKGAWFCQQGDRSFNMGADDAFTHWRPHPAPPDATAIRSGKPDGKE